MTGEPVAVYADLHAAAHRAVGARLFTVSVVDMAAGVARRAYTSHPDDYPVSGTKPLHDDRWSRHVLRDGQTFVANSTAEFADVFPDHPLITALGCASAVNIPVLAGGAVVGTVNVLDEAGHFTPARVLALQQLVAAQHGALVAAMTAPQSA